MAGDADGSGWCCAVSDGGLLLVLFVLLVTGVTVDVSSVTGICRKRSVVTAEGKKDLINTEGSFQKRGGIKIGIILNRSVWDSNMLNCLHSY